MSALTSAYDDLSIQAAEVKAEKDKLNSVVSKLQATLAAAFDKGRQDTDFLARKQEELDVIQLAHQEVI